jgi:hypothetical protein
MYEQQLLKVFGIQEIFGIQNKGEGNSKFQVRPGLAVLS